MSLLSLKKSKPSAKATLHTVDSFIDDAISYAAGKGLHQETPLETQANPHQRPKGTQLKPCLKAVKCDAIQKKPKGMRHATFTLTPECITQLSLLSQDSGVAKSALIREWISVEFAKRQVTKPLFTESASTGGGAKKK
ncbi:replication protein RepA [Alteromonas sp. P256]|uniref:replication protein RepA n=1 Tax=Alteromonas sp. P256 TaxID=3117399 RepID=UPI002FE2F6B6